ncbi:hypothetical protein [Clostridium botulinum]|uniref:hypothetical protein n=1 Tax=Clostridium botulinum TaxID=1491 RepID=UPI000A5B0573|nr:hypothetical protein [Clostridium botulinum]
MLTIGGFNCIKQNMSKSIKLEKEILKHSGKCISYKVSSEEIEKYLSKYNNIK